MDAINIELRDVSDPLFQAKFWGRIKNRGLCWEWQGARNDRGYGLVCLGDMTIRAHRISYVMAFGGIAPDKIICHTCDNPQCVNPLHLYEGTALDNARDCVLRDRHSSKHQKKRRTHIPDADIEQIRIRYASGDASQKELAEEYEVGRSTVQRIVQGKIHQSAPGPISTQVPGRPQKKREAL